ncbi:hypothetical protein Btru_032577 [Bulinus truncatus]|nr:hypothetical protein Btru_032577 [Bulinus truncatus]
MSVELTNLDHHVQVIRTKVFNLSKWLTDRNDALKHLKHSKIDTGSCNEREFQSLIDEAKRQHSVLNLTIVRGQRLLSYEKNALLEADLENLVCLWNSFEDNLHCLCCSHDSAEQICLLSCSRLRSSGLNTLQLNSLSPHEHSDFENRDSKEDISFGLKLLQKHILSNESNLNKVKSICTTHTDSKGKESNTSLLDVHTSESGIDSSIKSDHTLSCEKNCLKPTKFNSLSAEFAHLSKLFSNLDNGIHGSAFPEPQNEDDEKSESSSVNCCSIRSLASKSIGLKMSFDGSQNSLVEDDQVVPGSLVRKLSGDPMSSPYTALKMLEPVSFDILDVKRRRLLMDAANVSDISSRSESPLSFNSSRSETPTGTLSRADRSHELWKAIGSIDTFLMDKDIIEACKSTAGDLTCDAEDFAGAPNVSFTEFLQQYRELNDWLNQVHKVTQREITSLSEKYLNQM